MRNVYNGYVVTRRSNNYSSKDISSTPGSLDPLTFQKIFDFFLRKVYIYLSFVLSSFE